MSQQKTCEQNLQMINDVAESEAVKKEMPYMCEP